MAGKGLSTEELIKLLDSPIETDENGNQLYAIFNQENHCIYIKFDKIFNRDNLKQHNIFKIQHKRYYSEGTVNSSSKPMLPTICKDINYIMNVNEDAIRRYMFFSISIAMREQKEYELEQFKKDIFEFVDSIKNDVVKYVEDNYELNLTEQNDKINTDLQVTDEMNKVYIESAITMRIVIPIICMYTIYEKINNLFYDIFRNIMVKFCEINKSNNNPLTKLRSIVRSRIEQTKYSNKKIWSFNNTHTVDMKLVCEDFFIQLVESIIPKLDVNRSAIKYIDVVLRKKIEFAFTFNYPVEYKPLRNLENDDDTDERDRLNETIFTSSRNEASLALNKLTIKQHITKYKLNNDITDDDINILKTKNLKNKNINNIQNYFLFIFYGREFAVNIATEKDRLYLLHELINYLTEEGFTELPKILSCTVENEVDIRNKVVGKKLKNQNGFLKIIDKYSDVVDIINNDNFIVKMISFRNYNYFDENNKLVVINPNYFEREIISFILSL